MTTPEAKLYRRLGYSGPLAEEGEPGPAPRAATHALIDRGGEPPPLDDLGVKILAERLRAEPDAVLARARALWDADITLEELETAIASASNLLNAPERALESIEAGEAHARAAVALPPEFYQDWPYDPNIRIDPSSTKFETKADAVNWAIFSGPALIGSWLGTKAPFKWHHRHASNFIYTFDAPTQAHPVSLALVSDFGTGLYHSKYIAKHIKDRKYPYVIHGGDVYYAGRESEFATNFAPQIDPLLNTGTQVFTMNANHEMYSLGKPYFRYIERRKAVDPSQVQEGSYFCLRFGNVLQVVGIDTAYFRDGRYDETSLQRWLRQVLAQGRSTGAINVLFSPNEPYTYGSTDRTPLLTSDLASIVIREKLVDLWFWGNTHYCALFDRTAELPFYGSCIGHGGYPYSRMKPNRPSAAPVLFLETGARFPAWTNVRQDRGDNGFCEMTVRADKTLELKYIDWMTRERASATFSSAHPGAFALTRINA